MSSLFLCGTEICKLSDSDIEVLASALVHNTVFKGSLYLSDNSLTDQVLFSFSSPTVGRIGDRAAPPGEPRD